MGKLMLGLAGASSLLTPISIAHADDGTAHDQMVIILRPEASAPGSEKISRVVVELRFMPKRIEASRPILSLPHVVANVDTFATKMAKLRVTDDQGEVPMTARDREKTEGTVDADTQGQIREWVASRETRGVLTVRYSVPANAVLPPRGPAPPIGFSMENGGFSGTSSMFLPQPPGDQRYRLKLHWDLSGLAKNAIGVSSLGVGDVVTPVALSRDERETVFFMAGHIGVANPGKSADGFVGAWQGRPAFDAADMLNWTGHLYGKFRQFFGASDPGAYSVFLRNNPINAGGGAALYRSFVATFGTGPGTSLEDLKFVLSHEMFHTFQPTITVPDGLDSSWFTEGSAVLYQGRLPLRFGMIGSKAYLANLNFFVGRYYTSIMADQPNAEIAKRFWADTRIRTLPYDRGMLYLAGVDAAIRRASHGTRSLDDIQLEMLAAERGGHANSNDDWEAMLTREVGPDSVKDFRAFLSGNIVLPPSDAFGPCFRRVTTKLRRYELGFDPAVLAEPRRIVRGLIAGSTAAAAGLRNGDEIVVPVPQDAIQGTQDQQLKLRIQRNGRQFDILYLPRGETVGAYQWERLPDVAENRCAI